MYRHFAFIGDESRWAAEASQCAAEQGRFWELHAALFARQRGENSGAFSKPNLKQIARDLGLASSFDSCLDSGRYAATVRSETDAGSAKGVRATPTLFVNGQKLERLPTFEQLRDLVDRLAQGK